MKIERRSLLQNSFGLLGVCLMKDLCAAWVVDDRITVLKFADGHYSFKDHSTGNEPSEKLKTEILQNIEVKNEKENRH
ncbi:hypothetical protein Emin_0963 [Elusimicrobium minutum Pei191]|uniref:Uncharacterized protein n=1 Tax=Elusimicrobium minutum (strain Pei191) TaxID=445932 RepID=B2KDC0_ELUMP|nr:hypothetical protein [Elusimicrobium minutum]ACC98516.1 hypothetical protein Emin_0963 [Elusimicrobium minutum Pei191]